MSQDHKLRVLNELRQVGVSRYGMTKFSVRYAYKVIHKDEHVKGAVYGRYKEEGGTSFNEGLLIATDKRVLFLDHKPGFTKTDEMTYDVVSGINKTTTLFSAVTLRTRLGDYMLRFANPRCASIFANYVEKRRIEYQSANTDY